MCLFLNSCKYLKKKEEKDPPCIIYHVYATMADGVNADKSRETTYFC